MSLRTLSKLLVSLSLLACTTAFAVPLTFDIDGISSYGALGNPNNQVFALDVGAGATITSVAFDVNLTAFSPSWLSELGLAFTDSGFTTGVLLTPGFADANPGTASYAGMDDLVAEGLSFSVGADGILRLEFYEGYDDFAGVDGAWNFGTVTFDVQGGTVPPGGDVPEPPVDWLMGAGLALATYFGRRHASMSKKIT